MKRWALTALLFLSMGAEAAARDLAVATPEELLQIYAKLRELPGSDQRAVAENVVWKREAETFTLRDGRLSFAAPVEGRVLAAVFTGEGTFELDPPTGIARNQIGRFAGGPKLEAAFREAVFFFTDNSWEELQKLVNVRPGGDAATTGRALAAAQRKYSESFNDWWENERKGSFAIRNLSARMLADLTDPSRGALLRHRPRKLVSELRSLRRPHPVRDAFPLAQEVQVRGHGPNGEFREGERCPRHRVAIGDSF